MIRPADAKTASTRNIPNVKTTPKVVVRKSSSSLRIAWPNGIALSFALERGNVLGIRDVTSHGLALRSPKRLWRPTIVTDKGIHYHTFELDRVTTGKDGSVVVRCHAIGSPSCIAEELDEYLCDMYDSQRPDEPVRDVLEWRFKPSAQTYDGTAFAGFSYSYHFATKDKSRAIHRLFDDGTWEIGGKLAGNTLLNQGQCNPPAAKLSKAGYFTTACNYYGAQMGGILGIPKRVSFQRLPRFGTIQAFDMLVHPKGALLGVFEPLEEILSLVQTANGEDVLHVIDEVRRPKTTKFTTDPKHILFAAKPKVWTREAQRNLWYVVIEKIHQDIRDRYGVERSAVNPRVWIPQVYVDQATIAGQVYPREKCLYGWADHWVPKWAEMGVKEICVHSMWISDYTVDRTKTKDQVGGMHGQLVVGSICNVREHTLDPLWGGPEAMKYFVDAAHKHGMQVQLWWASHLSRRAPILAEHPEYMLMAKDGLANGGGFGHNSIITIDLNNKGCFDFMLEKMKKTWEATGFDGIFHDSYGNMTFLPMGYADPLRQGQQNAYGRFVHELQKIGIKTFTVEGIGALGVAHFGMDRFAGGAVKRGNYQHLLDWWMGEEDMGHAMNMGIGPRPWKGEEELSRTVAFRYLAFGGRFGFSNSQDGAEFWDGWIREQNLIYGRIAPLWGKRTILPGGKAVLWDLDRGGQVLFAFDSIDHKIPAGASVSRVTAEGSTPATVESGVLKAQAWTVYQW
jgi:hypothetical protein